MTGEEFAETKEGQQLINSIYNTGQFSIRYSAIVAAFNAGKLSVIEQKEENERTG
jgi:glutamate mutase epsilon subunit